MEKSLFRYIWRHSKRDQLIVFAVVLASLPFYFASLDLPRRIVNEAIQGKSFAQGNETAPFLQLSLGFVPPKRCPLFPSPAVIARQRVPPLSGPMTGSSGRSSNHQQCCGYWMPRIRGA